MYRSLFVIFSIVALAGCASNDTASSAPANSGAKSTTQAPTVAELAAYSASRHFPTTPAKSDLHTAAIINHAGGLIKIYNFDNTAMRNIDVWVNQTFVLRVGAIAPVGSVEIRFADLYNSVGRNLATQNEPIRQVQLVMQENLYNVWGPASE